MNRRVHSFVLVFLVFLSLVLVHPSFVPTVKANPSWLTGFQYRKSHVINYAAGAGTLYQKRIKTNFFSDAFSTVWTSGILATGTELNTARNQVIDGNYLYAVCSSGAKLVIFDITTPSAPVLESTLALTYISIDVRKKGNYLLISDTNGVTTVDVTDPSAPSIVSNNAIGYTHGMFLVGNYLYCCQHEADKFVILDVTDPTATVTKGSLSGTTYFNGAHDVVVDGIYAYVVNCYTASGGYGLTVVNVSDVDAPTVVTGVGETHNNSHIIKMGNYLYVGTHQPDSGMTVWNITSPTSPSFVGRFFEAEGLNFAYWMAPYGSNRFASVSPDTKKLYLIDISDPTNPLIATRILSAADLRPRNVVITGNYFYISCTQEDTFNWYLKAYEKVTPSDSGENVYLNQKSRSDFGDIRFTDDNGTTLLDYWMESKVDSEYAIFWVEVADDLSTVNQTIYCYYGNSTATTTSNGANTFPILFDDFEDGTVGSPPAGWTGDTANFNVRDDQSYGVGTKSLRAESLADTWKLLEKQFSAAQSGKFVLEVMARNDLDDRTFCFGETRLGTTQVTFTGFYYTTPYSNGQIYYYATGYIWIMDALADKWYKLKQIIDVGADTYDIYIDDVLKVDNAAFRNAVTSLDNYRLSSYAATFRWIDNLFIRKYVSPEPAHGSWGSEEEAGQQYIVDFTQPLTTNVVSSRLATMNRDFTTILSLSSVVARLIEVSKSNEGIVSTISTLSSTLALERSLQTPLSLKLALTKTLALQRTPEVTVSLDSTLASLISVSRLSSVSINLASSISKSLSIQRVINQPTSLHSTLENVFTNYRFYGNWRIRPEWIISSNWIIGGVQINPELELSQGLNVDTTLSRLLSQMRASALTVNLHSALQKILAISPSLSGSLSLTYSLSEAFALGRVTDQSFSLSTTIMRVFAQQRTVSTIMNLQTSMATIIGFQREVAQSISLETFSTKLLNLQRTTEIIVETQTSLERLTSLIVQLSQEFRLYPVLAQTLTLQRITDQTFSFDVAIVRILSLQRSNVATSNFHSALERLTGVFVEFSQDLTLSTTLMRALALQKTAPQNLDVYAMLTRQTEQQRTASLQMLLSTTLTKEQALTRTLASILQASAERTSQLSFYSTLQQFFVMLSETDKSLTLSRSLEQPLGLGTILQTVTEGIIQLSQNIMLSTTTFRTLNLQRIGDQPLSLASLLSKQVGYNREVDVHNLLSAIVEQQQVLTRESLSSFLSESSMTTQMGYHRNLQQFLTQIASPLRTVAFTKAIDQILNLQTSLAKSIGYIVTFSQPLTFSSLLQTELGELQYTLAATLNLQTQLQRQISITVNLASVLQMVLGISTEMVTPSVAGHVHVYVPYVITATLHPIEAPAPRLVDVWTKSVPVIVKVTVENHLDNSETVTIYWWVTKFRRNDTLIEDVRYVDLDEVNPKATAIIYFDLPVDSGLIPELDDVYAFHCYIEYSLGEQNLQTSQLITLFTLNDVMVQQHFIILAFIIVIVVVIVVVVYFKRQNEQVKNPSPYDFSID